VQSMIAEESINIVNVPNTRSTNLSEIFDVLTMTINFICRSEEIAQCAIKLELVNDCFTELRGEIAGPPGKSLNLIMLTQLIKAINPLSDTPYESGTFLLEIHVPETYPFNPPKVKFLTKIWHPNISSVTGAICLDILKDNWAAAMTLRTVLLSLQALLASAEPDDPQDAVVATQYKENHEMFCKTARHWTNCYAKGDKKKEI
jgi:ubiquitin-conjugating enzyme (huntingtin interacting protein 2)